MGCCGCRNKILKISEDEKVQKLKTYLHSLQQQQCSNCRGSLKRLPSGVIICSQCGKRK
jgi:hypothetical protein